MSDAGGILWTILILSCLCNMGIADKCSENPCLNDGKCFTRGEYDYQCICVLGWFGKNCEKNVDDCQTNKCLNGGRCVDEPNVRYKCICPVGYVGSYCELKNPCFPSHNCTNGAPCIPYQNGEFMCNCTKHFKGNLCEERTWKCPDDITQSRGMCNLNGKCDYDSNGAFVCKCDPGYTGEECREKSIHKLDIGCTNRKCFNGGICKVQENGISECQCLKDFEGQHCEQRVTSASGTRRREQHIDNPTEQTVEPMKAASNLPVVSTCSGQCQTLRANGICDQQCNYDRCQYDGGDCDPWKKCNNKRVSHCRYVFRDGKCDPECNSVDCLFDGQDCDKAPCINREKCSIVYQNGICNEDCNNPQCGFDGGDCHGKKSDSFFSNVDSIQKCSLDTKSFELDLIVLTTMENFQRNKSKFLQTLGSALKMVLTISKITEIDFRNSSALSIKININPTECVIYGGPCFSSLEQISNFIKAGLSGHSALSLPFKVANVDSRTVHSLGPGSKTGQNTFFLAIICMTSTLIISFIVIGVLLRDKWGRLRTKVKTTGVWTPSEGYSTSTSSINSNNKNGWPSLLQTNNIKLDQRHCDNGPLRFDAMKQSRLEVEFDAGILDANNRKRRYDNVDLHDKALTFQSISDQLQKRDGVTPIGPTQAKLLSIVNESLPTKIEQRHTATGDADDTNSDIGFYVNEVGESLMHVAARMNSGPNFIKKLHNASPGMIHTTDEWGRTPLATAAASDSYESVEQLLLLEKQSRKESKLNKIRSGHNSVPLARTSDNPTKSTTALIESVKLNSKELINLLLDEGSPVNILDSNGRSVVHWAAMFNNDVLLERLSHMKIFQKLVDLKDNEEKSPLYLASSEGAFESAKFIVEYITKVGIKIDQIFPCPRAIAEEKGFSEIERLISQAQLPSVFSEKAYKRMKIKDQKILKKLSSPTRELGIINEYKEYSGDSLKLEKNSPSGLDSIDSCLLDMYSLEDSSINNILDSCSNERNNYSSFKPLENNNYHSYLSNTSSSDMSPPLLNLHNPSVLNGYNCYHSDQLDPPLHNGFFLNPSTVSATKGDQEHHNMVPLTSSSDFFYQSEPPSTIDRYQQHQHHQFNLNNMKSSSVNCPL